MPEPVNIRPSINRRWSRLACYFPLAAIALQIAWVVLLFMGLIFMVGDTPFTNTPTKEHAFGLLSSLPVAVGLLVGLVALVLRWPSNKLEWISLIAGTLTCAALVYGCLR